MRAVWIALLLTAAPATAWAQFDNLYTGGVVIDPSNSLGTLLASETIRHSMARSASDKAPAAKPTRRKPIEATDFKGTGSRIIEKAYYRAMGATEEQEKAIAPLVDRTIHVFEKTGRKNNVAYALAVLVGVATQIRTGKRIPDERAEQLALDVNDALAADPAFRKLKAIDRQKLYESCLITASLMALFQEFGKRQSDTRMTRAAAQIADNVLDGIGKKK